MNNKISAKEYNLWDLMSGHFVFNVPDYQRPYSWTEKETVSLWDDLIEFWQETKTAPDRTYFIGSVVLVIKGNLPGVDIIDGQQRLSTLSLLLSMLYNHSSAIKKDITKCLWEAGIQHQNIPDKPRLTLRKRDASFFEKYIAKCNIDELLSTDPRKLKDDAQRLLLNNAIALDKCIKSFFDNDFTEVDSFITTLFNQCFFVVVTTTDNESAFRVFSVMNNRGLSLLPSDIIKSHIIGEIDENKRSYYSDKWENIEVDLGRDKFNALLSHIRMIYLRSKLHGTLVSEFEKAIFNKFPQKEDIVTSVIEPYAESYEKIINTEYSAAAHADEVNEYLSWLNRIDDSDWIPALMYAMVQYQSDSDFILHFSKKLERLTSYFYLASKPSNKRIERYASIIDSLKNHKSIDNALKSMDLTSSEKNEFYNILNGDVYLMPARKRKYVMLRLDRFISDKAAKYKDNIFSIEHVLPQTPPEGSQWLIDWKDDNIREYWLHKIANLIPLTRKKNSQVQNKDFKEKKEKYFSSKSGVTTYALATDVLNENEWTPEVVARRQERLMGVFAKYWELTDSIIPSSSTNNTIESIDDGIAKSAEIIKQEKLNDALNKYFAQNPHSRLPKLPSGNLKVGEFVRQSLHQLSVSGFEISQKEIDSLCTVEGSRKYTHRNLPFFIPYENASNTPYSMQRYWRKKDSLFCYNRRKYYAYSQWYSENKISKDAHKSDFLQFYLDIANHSVL